MTEKAGCSDCRQDVTPLRGLRFVWLRATLAAVRQLPADAGGLIKFRHRCRAPILAGIGSDRPRLEPTVRPSPGIRTLPA